MRSQKPGIIATLVLLGAVILLFECFPLDLRIQDHLYNPATGTWLVDARAPLSRLIFYTGPKALLFTGGAALAALLFSPPSIRRRLFATEAVRRAWLVVLATLASAPSLVALGKATTNVFCPYELSRYGGRYLYQPVFERYNAADRPAKKGKGFPAGHASGGFALLSLSGVGTDTRKRLLGLATGIAAGTAMGIYQMLKGAHFLSHTLVTAIVCWIVYLAWQRVLQRPSRHPPA